MKVKAQQLVGFIDLLVEAVLRELESGAIQEPDADAPDIESGPTATATGTDQ